MKKVLDWIKSNLWNIILIAGIVILFVVAVRQCSDAKEAKDINKHNIEALTDSVSYYKTKYGDEVASKAILIGDISTLKLANDSLAQKVEAMVKKPQQVVYINNDIVHEKHDTAWVNSQLVNPFDFSNQWRVLSGNVTLKDSVLGLNIEKDIVHADITVAIKDGRAYVSSDNPYLKVNDIQGVVMPKERQKRWHIGPQVGVGISEDLKVHGTLGVGLSYSIFSW